MPTPGSLERIADEVKALGFDIVDYLTTPESLEGFFTEEISRAIGEHARAIGLTTGGLVFQSDAWNNPDAASQARQLDLFRKCAKTAKAMGCGTISCIIPGPFKARPNRAGSPSEKLATNLPADFNWQAEWNLFTTMIGRACDIAAEYGLRIAMECFPRSLCATPHAMLKLLEDVKRPNLGIQLDTAHLMNQSIDVETAIFMLGAERIFNVHAKDSDGLTRGNLPCGVGRVDYTAVLAALKAIGYTGNVSIEVEFTDNPRRYMRQALEHLRLCMAGEY
jgi:sugar phosphate isomerase/epimerase